MILFALSPDRAVSHSSKGRHMPDSDLSELVAGKSEDLGVEYKAWMDTSPPEVRAKLARHIAALANHGGGYLILGVDDTTRQPQGAPRLTRHCSAKTRFQEL